MNRAITPPFAYGVSHALTIRSILATLAELKNSRATRPARCGGADDCRRTGAPLGREILVYSNKPNEQRLSDAAAALDKGRGGAWRQINPVELNRLSVGV